MIKLCDLRWRKRRSPSDILVGKVGDFWIMLVPRSGKDIGKDNPAHDLPYATMFIASAKPFAGPDLPEQGLAGAPAGTTQLILAATVKTLAR